MVSTNARIQSRQQKVHTEAAKNAPMAGEDHPGRLGAVDGSQIGDCRTGRGRGGGHEDLFVLSFDQVTKRRAGTDTSVIGRAKHEFSSQVYVPMVVHIAATTQ